jgi:hypothetical protein
VADVRALLVATTAAAAWAIIGRFNEGGTAEARSSSSIPSRATSADVYW